MRANGRKVGMYRSSAEGSFVKKVVTEGGYLAQIVVGMIREVLCVKLGQKVNTSERVVDRNQRTLRAAIWHIAGLANA